MGESVGKGVSEGVGVLVLSGVLVGIRVGTFAPSVGDGTKETTCGVGVPLHPVMSRIASRTIHRCRGRKITSHLHPRGASG